MFKKISGPSIVKWWPKKASTTITVGSLTSPDGSGAATVATAGGLAILGACLKAIVSTDSDFASNTSIPIELALPSCEFEADVTGTLTTAMIGEKRGLTASGTIVDATNTTNDQVTITAFISASKCRCVINENFLYEPGA